MPSERSSATLMRRPDASFAGALPTGLKQHYVPQTSEEMYFQALGSLLEFYAQANQPVFAPERYISTINYVGHAVSSQAPMFEIMVVPQGFTPTLTCNPPIGSDFQAISYLWNGSQQFLGTQTTQGPMNGVVDELRRKRLNIIEKRNRIFSNPLFMLWKPLMKTHLEKIDKELDDIDLQISDAIEPIKVSDMLETIERSQKRLAASLSAMERWNGPSSTQA